MSATASTSATGGARGKRSKSKGKKHGGSKGKRSGSKGRRSSSSGKKRSSSKGRRGHRRTATGGSPVSAEALLRSARSLGIVRKSKSHKRK